MVARAACKLGTGMELPIPELLGAFQAELGGESAEPFITLDELEGVVLNGSEESDPGGRVKSMVGNAYRLLHAFMDEQMAKAKGLVTVDHTKYMGLCEDGKGGKIWVSLKNIRRWNEQIAKQAHLIDLA